MGRGNTGEPEKTGEAGDEVGDNMRLEEVQVEGWKITTNPGPEVN